MRVVDVLVPVALDQAYSYRVPAGLDLKPGDVVAVPLGPRECLGVVWADNPAPNPRLHNRLKDVSDKLDVPPLKPELRSFVDWVAGYTLASRGMVLRMSLRMGEHLGPGRERVGVRLAGPPPQRMTAARARALELFRDGLTRAKGDAAREAGVSAGVIDGLIDMGALETVVLPPEPVAEPPDPDFAKPEFSLGQLAAADSLRTTVAQGGYTVTLLDGVTGSGKTEVYFEGVAENIRRKRQTLILMPEIALTAQFLDRFSDAFRRAPGGMAFAALAAHASAHLGGGGGERGVGDRRRALGAVSALRRSRPHHRRRRARPRLQAGGRRALSRPRHGGGARQRSRKSRCCSPPPRLPSNRKSTRGAAATAICICRSASAAPICRQSRRSTCGARARRAAASSRRGWPKPCSRPSNAKSRRCCSSTAAAMRRSRSAAPAASACSARIATPGWSITASGNGWSATTAASRCRRRLECPNCHATESFAAIGPGVERLEQEAAELFPQARILVLSSDLVESIERLRAGARRRGGRPLRSRHRHAAGRQGPSFPQAQSGRHRRRRLGAGQWRSARGRAHLPAFASGGRPRRARGGPGLRLFADAPARASGDEGADPRRPRGVLLERDRAARAHALSAVRPTRQPRHHRQRPPRRRKLRPHFGLARAARTTRCACWVPPKRRSRWCVGAIASGCW